MPVTELAWVPSRTLLSITPEYIEAGRRAIDFQNMWVAKHASSTLPVGPPAVRGAALFQQREDAGIGLLTAHWDSVAQHMTAIMSGENLAALETMSKHADIKTVKHFHVDAGSMLSQETLDAGLLSIVRITVEGQENGKEKVENVWREKAKEGLEEVAGMGHGAGWRVEKEKEKGKEEMEEFVVVGAWKSEDELASFMQGNQAWKEAWLAVALEVDVKSYRRLA
ncbi:hypothetical protein F4808DRAFT_352738 [Astrocystis sublimbata]|nr:hypothetical protein F4808DRAFT_352738 [Astrocystis sublimbata]